MGWVVNLLGARPTKHSRNQERRQGRRRGRPEAHSTNRARILPMKLVGFLCALAGTAFGQYSVHQDGDVIRLEDGARQTVVSVMPSRGNNAFQMTVKGKNVLQFPFNSAAEFKARGSFSGIPFLEPWANRLDETAFYANGKKYPFNLGLGNVRGPIPIHGLVSTASQWEVVEFGRAHV